MTHWLGEGLFRYSGKLFRYIDVPVCDGYAPAMWRDLESWIRREGEATGWIPDRDWKRNGPAARSALRPGAGVAQEAGVDAGGDVGGVRGFAVDAQRDRAGGRESYAGG